MLWRKDRYVLYMLASKETVLHLTTLSMEQEQKLNAPSLMCIKLIYSEAEKHLLAIGPPPFLRCLDGEQANLIYQCSYYPTGHAGPGVSFEDRNTYH